MRGVALVVSLSLGACSTTSTIHRARGPAYEAEIVDSDANRLRVLGDDGRLYEVSRDEITDVDHPGNVLLTVGASLVAFGAFLAISILDDGNGTQRDREAATIVGLVYGVPGLAMLFVGGVIYIRSKMKASAFENALVPAVSRPTDRLYQPPLPAPAPAAAPTAPAPEVVPAPPEVVPAPPAESPR